MAEILERQFLNSGKQISGAGGFHFPDLNRKNSQYMAMERGDFVLLPERYNELSAFLGYLACFGSTSAPVFRGKLFVWIRFLIKQMALIRVALSGYAVKELRSAREGWKRLARRDLVSQQFKEALRMVSKPPSLKLRRLKADGPTLCRRNAVETAKGHAQIK